jgi:hypothetical protein
MLNGMTPVIVSHDQADTGDLSFSERLAPPHITQIFQELDVSLFGVLKRKGQYKLPIEDDQRTAPFLRKTYRAFKQTMIETNRWGAFHELGFEFDTSVEPYHLLFHEEI